MAAGFNGSGQAFNLVKPSRWLTMVEAAYMSCCWVAAVLLVLSLVKPVAAAQRHQIVPTDEACKAVRSVFDPRLSEQTESRIRTARQAVDRLIIRQLNAAPDISAQELKAQLRRALLAPWAQTQAEDAVHVADVYADDWDANAAHREFLVAYSAFGGVPTYTVVEVFVVENGAARKTASNVHELKNFDVTTEEVSHLQGEGWWILAEGTIVNASGCALPWNAAVYHAGSKGIEVVWESPMLRGLRLTQLKELPDGKSSTIPKSAIASFPIPICSMFISSTHQRESFTGWFIRVSTCIEPPCLRHYLQRPLAIRCSHCLPLSSDKHPVTLKNMQPPSEEFYRIKKLPPYVFAVINELKAAARAAGQDIVDMGMGNPDGATPQPVVDKLTEAARNPRNHRYSMSRGIPRLRQAIVDRYQHQYGVTLDSETEAIVTIGAKDALAHLLFAVIGPGDVVVSPNPAYPIHQYGVIMAEGEACMLPMPDAATFLQALKDLYRSAAKKPKVILISFPHNPTTVCVDLDFMKEIVALAREHGTYIIHDFAYAELGFDGYKPPSILQVEGASDYAVEIYSMTKSYNMAGWRVGFCLGNRKLIAALARIKSYLDYGIFQPVQIASIIALRECHDAPAKICQVYKSRRDVLVEGLRRAGWQVEPPKGSMFLWARIPEPFSDMPSLEFAKLLMSEALVAVSPGIGFGPMGEGFVRFSLIENNHRTRQATKSIGAFLQREGVLAGAEAVALHV